MKGPRLIIKVSIQGLEDECSLPEIIDAVRDITDENIRRTTKLICSAHAATISDSSFGDASGRDMV